MIDLSVLRVLRDQLFAHGMNGLAAKEGFVFPISTRTPQERNYISQSSSKSSVDEDGSPS